MHVEFFFPFICVWGVFVNRCVAQRANGIILGVVALSQFLYTYVHIIQGRRLSAVRTNRHLSRFSASALARCAGKTLIKHNMMYLNTHKQIHTHTNTLHEVGFSSLAAYNSAHHYTRPDSACIWNSVVRFIS